MIRDYFSRYRLDFGLFYFYGPCLKVRRVHYTITPVIRVREPALAPAPHLELIFGKFHGGQFPLIASLRTCIPAAVKNCEADDPAA